MDHPTHKLDGYKDGFKWVAFCKTCGKEDNELLEPCPGKFIERVVDKAKEPN